MGTGHQMNHKQMAIWEEGNEAQNNMTLQTNYLFLHCFPI